MELNQELITKVELKTKTLKTLKAMVNKMVSTSSVIGLDLTRNCGHDDV